MKPSHLLLAAFMAASPVAAFAQDAATKALEKPDPNQALIGLTTENGRIAYNFVDTWFNQHKIDEAWDKYVSKEHFTNHAVESATTDKLNWTYKQWLAEERDATRGTHFDIKQVVAEGPWVFMHIAARQDAPPPNQPGVNPAPTQPAAAGAPPAGGPQGGQQGDGKGPDELIMIMKVENGKITDHWDLHSPTNSNSVVFTGL
jgi:predicted SnoaL-like aldol condensation-catalyzing enzyme